VRGGQRRQRSEEKGTTIGSKVFVGNLSFRTTKEELAGLLAEAGSVVDVFLPTDRATGKPRGFAFVEFGSEAEAAEAIRRFHGREVGGRAIRLNMADERPRERTGPPRSFGPPPDRPSFGGDRPGPPRDRPGPPRERSGPPRSFGPSPFEPEPTFFAVEGRMSRPKGSRRGARGRKRSL
jgi:RNA recognition motif-containing protein